MLCHDWDVSVTVVLRVNHYLQCYFMPTCDTPAVNPPPPLSDISVYHGAACGVSMPAIVSDNLMQQFEVSKPEGLWPPLLLLEGRAGGTEISAMPGHQRAFGNVLRIDPQWGTLPSVVWGGTVVCRGAEEEVSWGVCSDFNHRGACSMQECLSTCGLLLEGTRILRWGGRRRSEVFADRFVLNHWRRVRRAAMMEPSTSELLFISVNHSITLMGKLSYSPESSFQISSLLSISWF